MRALLLLTLLCFGLNATLLAQINLPKGKDLLKNKNLTEKVKTGATDLLVKRLEKSKEEYEKTSFNYAISFTDNAGLFETKERYDKHRAVLLEGVKQQEAKESGTRVDKSAADRAYNSNASGEMLYANNKFKSAELAFLAAKLEWEAAGKTNSNSYALTLSNLGLLYMTTGRYTKSEEYTQAALKIRQSILRNTEAHAASVNNLAVLRKEQGQYNEAEKLIKEALEISAVAEGTESLTYAIALNNKAMLFQAVGRYDEAAKLMIQSTDLAKTHLKENSSEYVKFSMNLALLYKEMEQYEASEALYLSAMETKAKKLGKNHPDYAHLTRGLAALYWSMGKEDQVEDLLKDAANIYQKKFGKNHPSYASTINDLGTFYRSKGDYTNAGPLLEEATATRLKLLGPNHPDYITSLENVAIYHWRTSQLEQASREYAQVMNTTMDFIDRYFAPMSEVEKAQFWSQLQPRLQRFYNFASTAEVQQQELLTQIINYQLKTKALLLSSTNKVRNAILSSGDQQLIEKYTAWLDKKEELARLYTLSKAELAEEGIDPSALEREANALEKELSSASNAFSSGYGGTTDITCNDLKKQLAEEEVLIEIIRMRQFEHVFTDQVHYLLIAVNSGQGQPTLVLNTQGLALEGDIVNNYRNNIYDLQDDSEAYNAFWKPIEGMVKGRKNVYVSLDGVFNLVSLKTLKNDAGKYVFDLHNVIILTNSKDLIEVKSATANLTNKSATLFGYPNYGDIGKLSKLPGTKLEVENIDGILQNAGFKTAVFMADEASETNVKQANSSILHIATHGFFLPDVSRYKREKILGIEISKAQENPLHRSGLILAGAEETMYRNGQADHSTSDNGILTAYETMNMPLENTDLVILSACETGLGDIKAGEGVYGLQRAFQVAGAKSMIMSLWQVSDDATMLLMTEFYKEYAASGDKRAAFIKAQQVVKSKYPQPFYWGAFVLIGH